jgi:segregation and condensation protein B
LEQTEKQAPSLSTEEKEEPTPEKIHSDLPLVEAALYVAGRPLDLNDLCSVLKTRSKKRARRTVDTLKQEYTARNTALEILELKDERFVLQLKADFTPHVRKFVNRPLLSVGPLKTLSYIAYRQPVSQKRVIDVRGRHAYGHIKVLKDMGIVGSERNGRSMLLRTTEYFADYFGLSLDTSTMKKELKHVFQEPPKQENRGTNNG